jgi:hypothetical protein
MSQPLEYFTVKHYVSEDFPSVKGNGFDGLFIADSKEEAQLFIDFVNSLIKQIKDKE